jgi:hypothetical protein
MKMIQMILLLKTEIVILFKATSVFSGFKRTLAPKKRRKKRREAPEP